MQAGLRQLYISDGSGDGNTGFTVELSKPALRKKASLIWDAN